MLVWNATHSRMKKQVDNNLLFFSSWILWKCNCWVIDFETSLQCKTMFFALIAFLHVNWSAIFGSTFTYIQRSKIMLLLTGSSQNPFKWKLFTRT